MQTRFLTSISLRFNPFRVKSAKTCRSVLAHIGPEAWSSVKVDTQLLPRESAAPSGLRVVFQDGKEMLLDTEKLSFKDIAEEVARHSRMLSRKAELAG